MHNKHKKQRRSGAALIFLVVISLIRVLALVFFEVKNDAISREEFLNNIAPPRQREEKRRGQAAPR